MFRNNIIQPVNQFWFPEPDVRGAFLKVSDAEHLIFIAFFTLNRPDVIIQTNSDVFPVAVLMVRNQSWITSIFLCFFNLPGFLIPVD